MTRLLICRSIRKRLSAKNIRKKGHLPFPSWMSCLALISIRSLLISSLFSSSSLVRKLWWTKSSSLASFPCCKQKINMPQFRTKCPCQQRAYKIIEFLVRMQTDLDVIHVGIFELFFKVGVLLEKLNDFPEVAVVVQSSVLMWKKNKSHQCLLDYNVYLIWLRTSMQNTFVS